MKASYIKHSLFLRILTRSHKLLFFTNLAHQLVAFANPLHFISTKTKLLEV